MTPERCGAEEVRRIYMFAGFDDEQIERVVKTTRCLSLEEGERLFDFGQPARTFFFLRSGQIKLFRNSVDGGEKVIEIIRPGDTFAEAVMFMGAKMGYPVSAEAIAPSDVLAFDQRTMLDILHGSVESCFTLMANMSMRLRRQLDEIDQLTLHNATFRLVSFLLQDVDAERARNSDVRLNTPKNVIASRLSIQPETLSRILARLARQSLIEVRGHDITLLDVDGLRAMVRF